MSIVWETDLFVALNRAAKENKLILVKVWADWCPPCHLLNKHVFTDPQLTPMLSNLVLLSLLVEKANRSKTKAAVMATMLKAGKEYPQLILLDKTGRRLKEKFGGPSSIKFISEAVSKIEKFIIQN